MRRMAVGGLVALTATAALAGTASAGLGGSYTAKLTGGTQIRGTWQVTFTDGKGILFRNNKKVVTSKVTRRGSTLSWVDLSGPLACKGATGRYRVSLKNDKLTFKLKSDLCYGRRTVLTAKPFKRK